MVRSKSLSSHPAPQGVQGRLFEELRVPQEVTSEKLDQMLEKKHGYSNRCKPAGRLTIRVQTSLGYFVTATFSRKVAGRNLWWVKYDTGWSSAA